MELNVITQHTHFEVTIREEPLSDIEIFVMQAIADTNEVEFSVSKSGRIVLFSKVADIKTLITILADMGLAEEIGLIKEIKEYWPEYDDEPYLTETIGDI